MNVWFYAIGEKQYGPVAMETLKELATHGTISRQTLIWKDGMPDWVPASSIEGLFVGPPPLAPPSLSVSAHVPAAGTRPADQGTDPSWASAEPTDDHAGAKAEGTAQVSEQIVTAAQNSLILWLASIGLLAISFWAIVFSDVLVLVLTGANYLLPLGVLAGLAAGIFTALFVARCWKVLPLEVRPASPHIMAILLLIPIVNMGWSFVAIWKLSKETSVQLRKARRLGSAPESVALAVCSLAVFYLLMRGISLTTNVTAIKVLGLAALLSSLGALGLWIMGQTKSMMVLTTPSGKSPALAPSLPKIFQDAWHYAFGVLALVLLISGSATMNIQEQACTDCGGTGNIPCFSCNSVGLGSSGFYYCSTCDGRRFSECPSCGGSGKARN